jgi:hypothetical protein
VKSCVASIRILTTCTYLGGRDGKNVGQSITTLEDGGQVNSSARSSPGYIVAGVAGHEFERFGHTDEGQDFERDLLAQPVLGHF